MIDVDGVISLFGFDQTGPPEGRFVVVDGNPHLISARAGERLGRLAEVFEASRRSLDWLRHDGPT